MIKKKIHFQNISREESNWGYNESLSKLCENLCSQKVVDDFDGVVGAL